MPVGALVDDVPLYDLEPEEPAEPLYPRPAGAARSGRRRRAETLLALLGSPEHRLEAVRVRAVRLDRRLAHGAPARVGRRRGAGARAGRRQRRARGLDRRQRPARGVRSRTRARSRPCSSARATSRAWAPSRSGSPTASTSATPRSRTSRGSSRARCEGIRDACLALGVPVVGGNVSLYNEGGEGPIYPTPVVGMVGKLPEPRGRAAHGLRGGGPRDRARRACSSRRSTGRSSRSCAAAWRARCRRSTWRRTPTRSCACARRSAAASSPTAHDVSEGGLACALAECCIAGGLGAGSLLDAGDERRRCSARARAASSSPAPARGDRGARRRAAVIGEVGGDELEIDGAALIVAAWRDAARRVSSAPTPPALAAAESLARYPPTASLTVPDDRVTSTTATDLATSAASSACTRRTPTSPGSRTSPCTPSSTGARSRRGSPPPRTATS